MAQVKFVLDKETKNKQRFVNQEGDVVGTLYLSKEKAGDKKEIVVTVED
jgi:hypothetical protein